MYAAGDHWRLGRRPALDGLRGVAILLVLVGHFAPPEGESAVRGLGVVGVTVFFTLSGFLITSLLLEEAQKRGTVSLAGFYARRARRLLPALVVMVAVVGAFQTAAGIASLSVTGWVFAYLGNWPLTHGAHFGLLLHTWSLAIEEQFYVVWPVLFLLVRRWRTGPLVGFVTTVALTAALWRVHLWDTYGETRIYFRSDVRIDTLLVGCLLAILLHRGARLHVRPMVALGLTVVAGVAGPLWYGPAVAGVWIPSIIPALTAVVILSSLTAPGVLGNPVLRWCGRRSYGLYLWHYPLVAGAWLVTDSAVARFAAIGAAFVLAELSWRYVEQPFMRRRTTQPTLVVATRSPAAALV